MKYDLKQSKPFSSFDSIVLRFGNTGTGLRNIAKPGKKKYIYLLCRSGLLNQYRLNRDG